MSSLSHRGSVSVSSSSSSSLNEKIVLLYAELLSSLSSTFMESKLEVLGARSECTIRTTQPFTGNSIRQRLERAIGIDCDRPAEPVTDRPTRQLNVLQLQLQYAMSQESQVSWALGLLPNIPGIGFLCGGLMGSVCRCCAVPRPATRNPQPNGYIYRQIL